MDELDVGFTQAEKQSRIAPSPKSNQPPRSSEPQHPLQWPRLPHLQLGADDALRRRDGIGGSDANVILSGDSHRVRQLWLEKRGEAEPADLNSNLAVMLGCWTEPFNRQWYERLTGHGVEDVGRTLTCSRYAWRRCTLDGLIKDSVTKDNGAIWEAKHTNAFASCALTASSGAMSRCEQRLGGLGSWLVSLLQREHRHRCRTDERRFPKVLSGG